MSKTNDMMTSVLYLIEHGAVERKTLSEIVSISAFTSSTANDLALLPANSLTAERSIIYRSFTVYSF